MNNFNYQKNMTEYIKMSVITAKICQNVKNLLYFMLKIFVKNHCLLSGKCHSLLFN